MGLRSNHILVSVSSFLTLMFFLLSMMLPASVEPSDEENFDVCDLSDCLDLFQAAQESLQIRYDYPVPRHHTLPPEDVRARCITLRTFYHCLQTMSRSCHGDLGFHSSQKVIDKQMKQLNCSQTGPVFEPHEASHSNGYSHPDICTFSGLDSRQYCAAFGDPHIKTFRGVFQTCRMQGAWPLLDNEFLSVQVTSEPIGSAESTAITKVTVMIKKHEECSHEHYVTYQAVSNDLPSTFDDGQTAFGLSDSVALNEIIRGAHVEITISYIDTTLVIRQHGQYFSVGVLIPDEIINQTSRFNGISMQLCASGCSSYEQVDLAPVFKLKTSSKVGYDQAILYCKELGLVDYFLDSCIYDLLLTNDHNFTSAVIDAFSDFVRLHPSAAAELFNRTVSAAHRNANSRFYLSGICILVIILVFLRNCSDLSNDCR